MRFLVTRPRSEAERTAAALKACGHDALLAPLLIIAPMEDASIGEDYDAVLMTSGNAARALAAHPARSRLIALPLFAVGGQTAEAARQAGFESVVSADGDAFDLAELLRARFGAAGGRLLYLAGSDRARDLAGDLAGHGIAVDTVVIYRADAATEFPAAARAALADGSVDGVIHFSQRTANIFVRCAQTAGLTERIRRLPHYCLSRRVTEPLAASGATDLRVAPRPDETSLLGLIRSA